MRCICTGQSKSSTQDLVSLHPITFLMAAILCGRCVVRCSDINFAHQCRCKLEFAGPMLLQSESVFDPTFAKVIACCVQGWLRTKSGIQVSTTSYHLTCQVDSTPSFEERITSMACKPMWLRIYFLARTREYEIKGTK
jgi:hypothetical protein